MHGPVAPLKWTFFRFETQSVSLWIHSLALCIPHLKYSKLLHFLNLFVCVF